MKTAQLFQLFRLMWPGERAEAFGLDSAGHIGLWNENHTLFYCPGRRAVCQSLPQKDVRALTKIERTVRRVLLRSFAQSNRSTLMMLTLTRRPWGAALGEETGQRLAEVQRDWRAMPGFAADDNELPLADLCHLGCLLGGRPYSLTGLTLERGSGITITTNGPHIAMAHRAIDGTLTLRPAAGQTLQGLMPSKTAERLWQRFEHDAGAWLEAFERGEEERL